MQERLHREHGRRLLEVEEPERVLEGDPGLVQSLDEEPVGAEIQRREASSALAQPSLERVAIGADRVHAQRDRERPLGRVTERRELSGRQVRSEVIESVIA